jgi:hypothetical protein
MSGSKIVSGTCHKSMWDTSAYKRRLDECGQTGRDRRRDKRRAQAGAPRVVSMQILKGDADFGADPMLAVIGGMVDLKAPRTGRRSGQEQTALTRIF